MQPYPSALGYSQPTEQTLKQQPASRRCDGLDSQAQADPRPMFTSVRSGSPLVLATSCRGRGDTEELQPTFGLRFAIQRGLVAGADVKLNDQFLLILGGGHRGQYCPGDRL